MEKRQKSRSEKSQSEAFRPEKSRPGDRQARRRSVPVSSAVENGTGALGGSAAGPELSSVGFAHVARQLAEVARSLGFQAPGFRSPPRKPDLNRSITRHSDGSATVAVALRGRPAAAVVADMVEGVIVASVMSGGRDRDRLWAAAQRQLVELLVGPAGHPGENATVVGRRGPGGRPGTGQRSLRSIEGRAA